jgi:hypothetical protein
MTDKGRPSVVHPDNIKRSLCRSDGKVIDLSLSHTMRVVV